MSDIILHHYEMSPVSELMRVALGVKGLAWKSVLIPMMLPKPDLLPLTGGYRKTPVMQIGADIYCDSHRMIDVLEAHTPLPSLLPQPFGALARGMAQWLGAQAFSAAAATALASVHDSLPEAFWEDRKALFGMDKGRLQAVTPHLQAQWSAGLQLFAETLGDGRAYLSGTAPGYLDCAAYMDWWFGGRAGPPVAKAFAAANPVFVAWAERMKAIGHGHRSEMTAGEAIAIAKAATSRVAANVLADTGFAAGQAVAVLTEDPGATPVFGALLVLTHAHIAVKRSDPAVGEVVVHFPRLGYVVKPV
jgi:glutathione S-transferase